MKKFLTILLVVALVLALAAAGGAGYIWYRNNHIFVEGDAYPIGAQSLDLREEDIGFAYYDQVHAQLPGCEILWNVPFQGGKVQSDTRELSVKSLSAEDGKLLSYFSRLKTVTVTESDKHTDYELLISIQEQYPEVQINYQVNLGGSKSFPLGSTELTLEQGEYTAEFLKENLRYLPNVTQVTQIKAPTMDFELEERYPEVEFQYIVELLGQDYDSKTTQLDLSALSGEDVHEVGDALAMLPNLETVELMDAAGESKLSKEDVLYLKSMAPDVTFRYSFEFYGETISTDAEEVYLSNKKIGDEGIDDVRQALDLMGPGCKRFVLENCGIDYELLAKVREEYRGKTNVVWRIYFGKGGSCLTDREVIKAVYDLVDDNSKDLIYCEGARFIDFGHNEYLDSCEFVSGMPNLEAIILSGSPVKDLTPFQNCKKLKFLELGFCGYVQDLSPLAGCESLEMLNICGTKVSDYSPLDELPMKLMCAKTTKSSAEEEARFREKHPDCWSQFQKDPPDKMQPYGPGWRYTEDGKEKLPYYAMLAEVFEYAKGVEAGINYTRW